MRALLLLLASVLAACAGPTVCPECDPADERFAALQGRAFLIDALRFAPSPGASPGLDLDGMGSGDGSALGRATCEELEPDHPSDSRLPFDGVDNAGQALIRTAEDTAGGPTFADALLRALADDRLRWIVRVGGDPEDDTPASVPLEVWVVPEGTPIERDASGRPVLGQRLAARSVGAAAEASVSGLGAWGLLDAPPPAAELSVTGGNAFLLPFDDLRLGGVVLRADPGDARRVSGSLGGSFSVDALVALSVELSDDFDGVDEEDIFRRLYESVADIDPSAADATVCDRVSVGFAYDALEVALAP